MMKSYFMLAAVLTIPTLASGEGKTLPYSSTMVEGKAVHPEWTIVDNNNDCPKLTGNGCWQYDSSSKLASDSKEIPADGLKYQYHGNNNADDWAVSPAITLKAGEEYKVGYWFKVSSAGNKENLTIYVTKVSPMIDGQVTADYTNLVSNDPSTKIIADYQDYNTASWPKAKIYTDNFTVDEDGDYYVGFYCHSVRNRYNVLIRGFEIKDNKIYPATPTDLNITAAANDVVAADIAWTLPTTDTEGHLLDGALDAVKVSRDGVEIATLDGDAVAFTDTEELGLTTGVHTYSVAVVYNGVQGEAVSAKSKWIGAIATQQLPYLCDFEDAEMFGNLWTVINPDGITATSGLQPTCYTWSIKSGWLAYFTPYNPIVDDDDWAITPPLNFDKPGTYKVSVKAYKQSGTPTISMWLGSDRTAEAMTQKIGDVEIPSTANMESKAVTIENTIDVVTPGKYYVGLWINGEREKSSQRKPMLDDFKVELVAELQIAEPPYDSADDENWQSQWNEVEGDLHSPMFAFKAGYYTVEHQSNATSVAFSNESFRLFDFEPATNDATEASTSTFAVDEPANSKIILKEANLESTKSVKLLPVDLTPAVADELKAVSNEDPDAPALTLTWTLPVVAANDSWLPEIRKVVLARDGQPLAQWEEDVYPGKEMQHVDNDIEANKDYVYTLTSSNHSGESEAAITTAKVASGVAGIDADTDDTVAVYNLMGVKIADNLEGLTPGVYIKVKGDAATKIVVK